MEGGKNGNNWFDRLINESEDTVLIALFKGNAAEMVQTGVPFYRVIDRQIYFLRSPVQILFEPFRLSAFIHSSPNLPSRS